jgi:transposase
MRDKDIAVPVDCHPEVVSKWRRRFCEQRIEGSKDKPRAGRPRRFPRERVVAVRLRAADRAGRAAGALYAL